MKGPEFLHPIFRQKQFTKTRSLSENWNVWQSTIQLANCASKGDWCDLWTLDLFFIVHIPENITVELICFRACTARTLAQGTRRRHDHQTRWSFVHRTAPSRGQRKVSVISWCQVILHCRDGWLKGAKSKICLKLGSSSTSSAANFSNTIQEEKNLSACKQLKRLKRNLELFIYNKNA